MRAAVCARDAAVADGAVNHGQVTCSRDIAVIYYLTKAWKVREAGGEEAAVVLGEARRPQSSSGEARRPQRHHGGAVHSRARRPDGPRVHGRAGAPVLRPQAVGPGLGSSAGLGLRRRAAYVLVV